MILDTKWKDFLHEEFEKEYFLQLKSFIEEEYQEKTIYPKYNNIFRAFNLVKPHDVKIVIVGQDPYHGANQANGLAFSVCDSCVLPPSLKNIYKELESDIGCEISTSGNLESWAKQGILLINTILTVREKEPYSHKNIGWEIFTDNILNKLSKNYENIVFILWGSPSQKKEKLIDNSKHYIIKSVHPSPLSSYRGFFGSKPFSLSNKYLVENNKKPIKWCLKG